MPTLGAGAAAKVSTVSAPTLAMQPGDWVPLVTEKVFFDISIGGAAPQRVELGLYGDTRCTIKCRGASPPTAEP